MMTRNDERIARAQFWLGMAGVAFSLLLLNVMSWLGFGT